MYEMAQEKSFFNLFLDHLMYLLSIEFIKIILLEFHCITVLANYPAELFLFFLFFLCLIHFSKKSNQLFGQ